MQSMNIIIRYLYLYRVHCYIPEMVILQRVRERGSNQSCDSRADLNASTLSHLTKESLRLFQSNVVLPKNEFLYWSVLQDGTVKPLLLLQTDLLTMFMMLKLYEFSYQFKLIKLFVNISDISQWSVLLVEETRLKIDP